MKSWKRSIISLAVAFALLASFIPAPASVASAVDGETTSYVYNFALSKANKEENTPIYSWYIDQVTNKGEYYVNDTTLKNPASPNDSSKNIARSRLTNDVRGFNSAEYENYSTTVTLNSGEVLADWSLHASEYDSSITDSYMEKKDYLSAVGRISFQGVYTYIQGGIGDWVTFRINVPEAGWYTPKITSYYNGKRGSIYRAYIAPIASEKTAGKLNQYDLLELRSDKYSIGLADCYDTDTSAKASEPEVMRTMYFATAGEYAFTIAAEKADKNNTILINKLSLEKAENAGDIAIDLDSIITAKSFVTDETVSFDVPASLGDDANNILKTADSVTFESDKISAYYMNNKIYVTGDYAAENASLKISIIRDGVAYEDSISGLSVTGEDSVLHKLTYNLKQKNNKNPIATETSVSVNAYQDCRVYNSATDTSYAANGYWSTNDEHSSFANKFKSGDTAHWNKIRFQGAGFQIQSAAAGHWVTIRIKVDRRGWYTPTMNVWKKNNGGIFSVYIAPVSKAPGVITETELEALRAEEYCIGQISCDNGSDTSDTTDNKTNMRTVYLEAGEYAFTIKTDGKDDLFNSGNAASGNMNNFQMFPSSLELTRVAKEENAINADVFSGAYAYLVGNDSGTYDMHLFGGINTIDGFESVGFEVVYMDGTVAGSASSDKVYNSITVKYQKSGAQTTETIKATDLGLSSGHVFHRVIENIDVSADEGYYVTAYAVDENGNTVYGYSTAISVKAKA